MERDQNQEVEIHFCAIATYNVCNEFLDWIQGRPYCLLFRDVPVKMNAFMVAFEKPRQ